VPTLVDVSGESGERVRVRVRTGRSRRRSRTLVRRRVLIGVAIAVGLVVLWGGWVGVRGWLAKGELEAALPAVPALQKAVVAQDLDAAQAHADSLALHTAEARSLTSDVLWRAAEVLPWIGPNLTVMRELAASADDLAVEVVPPLLDVAADVTPDRFTPVDGRFDMAPLVEARPVLQAAAVAADAALARAESVADLPVIGPLESARTLYLDRATQAAALVGGVAGASELLPAALGVDGPRNILLLFQNNAELRATGGIPGALALIRADGGAISLSTQASTADFRFSDPIMELDRTTTAVYTTKVAKYIQDVNLTPRFDVAASVAATMWQQVFGDPIDMVVAIDPVVLAGVLEATGPITLENGDVIAADTVVDTLLSGVYARFSDSTEQDAYFALVAATVFERLANGAVSPEALIPALTAAADQRRVLVWSTDEYEQARLGDSSLGGRLPIETNNEKEFGLYFNDATGSKMDLYLDASIGVGMMECRADGRPEYVLEVGLTNTLTTDEAAALPRYVTGGGLFGTQPGDIRTNVYAYGSAPSYGFAVTRDGEPTGYFPFLDQERPASAVEVLLAPGESTVLRFHYLGETAKPLPPVALTTPFVYVMETVDIGLECSDALS